MPLTPEQIEQEIKALKERNARVEADKAWEVSWFRKASIIVITYIIASLVMWVIKVPNFFLSALIPTLGYFLSTQSLPFIKRWWVRERFKK